MPLSILWTARSRNRKTGDVPTAWVGADVSETRASCVGCPRTSAADGGDGTCYAWSGPTGVAIQGTQRAAADRPRAYTLESAIAGAARSARMVRVTGLGDAGRAGRAVADHIVATARAAGLAVVGYTQHHAESAVADAWRGRLMASVHSLVDADDALSRGWRVAVTVAPDYPRTSRTPAGAPVVVCPAQVGRVTCNDCRLCDASRPGPVIAFREHGLAAERLRARENRATSRPGQVIAFRARENRATSRVTLDAMTAPT